MPVPATLYSAQFFPSEYITAGASFVSVVRPVPILLKTSRSLQFVPPAPLHGLVGHPADSEIESVRALIPSCSPVSSCRVISLTTFLSSLVVVKSAWLFESISLTVTL